MRKCWPGNKLTHSLDGSSCVSSNPIHNAICFSFKHLLVLFTYSYQFYFIQFVLFFVVIYLPLGRGVFLTRLISGKHHQLTKHTDPHQSSSRSNMQSFGKMQMFYLFRLHVSLRGALSPPPVTRLSLYRRPNCFDVNERTISSCYVVLINVE